MSAKNTQYRLSQIHYLRQHYADLPPAHFAQAFDISVSKVYDLARRYGARRRAPNGQPEWRQAA